MQRKRFTMNLLMQLKKKSFLSNFLKELKGKEGTNLKNRTTSKWILMKVMKVKEDLGAGKLQTKVKVQDGEAVTPRKAMLMVFK